VFDSGRKWLEIFADETTSPSPPCSHPMGLSLRNAVTQLFRPGPPSGVGKLRPGGGSAVST